MSNNYVSYLPQSNEIGGLQSFGALTVFENLNLGYTGITGPTGPRGVTGITGVTGTFSNTFPSGDVLYSNGDTTVGTTGGLFWNQYTQTMITSNASANTYTLGSNGNLFPPPPAPVTIYLGSPFTIPNTNIDTVILSESITTPNYGTTWGIEVSYNLITNTSFTVLKSVYVLATSGTPRATSTISNTNSYEIGINNSDQFSLGVGPNTTLTLSLYGINSIVVPVIVETSAVLNSNIKTFLTYRFILIN